VLTLVNLEQQWTSACAWKDLDALPLFSLLDKVTRDGQAGMQRSVPWQQDAVQKVLCAEGGNLSRRHGKGYLGGCAEIEVFEWSYRSGRELPANP
jgi:hypothetical protein